jgi:hypothetical protein
MIDRERLEKLREATAEIRADLERREADPYLQDDILREEGRQAIARARAAEPAKLVYKTVENVRRSNESNGNDNAGGDPEVFTDLQLDVLAIGLAEARNEISAEIAAATAPLVERIVRLEGQVTTLLQLFGGGDGSRALDKPPLRLAKPT